jgi:hypothetical protein
MTEIELNDSFEADEFNDQMSDEALDREGAPRFLSFLPPCQN